jgi:hypothetical protein
MFMFKTDFSLELFLAFIQAKHKLNNELFKAKLPFLGNYFSLLWEYGSTKHTPH